MAFDTEPDALEPVNRISLQQVEASKSVTQSTVDSRLEQMIHGVSGREYAALCHPYDQRRERHANGYHLRLEEPADSRSLDELLETFLEAEERGDEQAAAILAARILAEGGFDHIS